jgi:hypothetical protein
MEKEIKAAKWGTPKKYFKKNDNDSKPGTPTIKAAQIDEHKIFNFSLSTDER